MKSAFDNDPGAAYRTGPMGWIHTAVMAQSFMKSKFVNKTILGKYTCRIYW